MGSALPGSRVVPRAEQNTSSRRSRDEVEVTGDGARHPRQRGPLREREQELARGIHEALVLAGDGARDDGGAAARFPLRLPAGLAVEDVGPARERQQAQEDGDDHSLPGPQAARPQRAWQDAISHEN